MLGLFNKGKTWFLSRLADSFLPKEGNTAHTAGLGFKFCHPHGVRDTFVIVDSEGMQAPLEISLRKPFLSN